MESSDQNNVKRNRNGEGEAAQVPQEIVREILLKLPVRSLLRFKSVHKQWRSLISDPHFGKQHHLTMAAANRRVCAVFRSLPSPRVSLSSVYLPSPPEDEGEGGDIEVVQAQLHCPFREEPILFVGSANGLLFAWDLSQAVFLWNPSTGEYKKFPQLSRSRISVRHVTREPELGTKISGFGYDCITDEYKGVILHKSQVDTQMFLFTSKTGLWTDSKYCHDYPYYATFSPPAVTINNGSPHWVVQQNDEDGDLVILFFDWAEETLKEVPVPDLLIHKDIIELDLADFGGCISLADCSSDSSIDVWVMKEHGVKDSWTKLFVIPKLDSDDYLIPLGFAKDGEEVLLLVNEHRLVTHNLKTGAEFLLSSLSSVRRRPREHGPIFYMEDVAVSCMESLISPNDAEAIGH